MTLFAREEWSLAPPAKRGEVAPQREVVHGNNSSDFQLDTSDNHINNDEHIDNYIMAYLFPLKCSLPVAL